MYQAVRLEPSSTSTSIRGDVESSFLSASEEDEQRKKLAYKPPAIRLPYLLLYFTLLGLCLGLIEWALSKTEIPKTTTTTQPSPSLRPRRAIPRQFLNSTSTDACPYASSYSSILQNKLSDYATLCADYSNTYLPYANSLPSSLQEAFPTWEASISSNQDVRISISSALTYCGARPTTADSNGHITTIAYAGCYSWTTTIDSNACSIAGSLYLIGGYEIDTLASSTCAGHVPTMWWIPDQQPAPPVTSSTTTPISSTSQGKDPCLEGTQTSRPEGVEGPFTGTLGTSLFTYCLTITSDLISISSQPTLTSQPIVGSVVYSTSDGKLISETIAEFPTNIETPSNPTKSGSESDVVSGIIRTSTVKSADRQQASTISAVKSVDQQQPSTISTAPGAVQSLNPSSISDQPTRAAVIATSYSTVLPGQILTYTYTGTAVLSNSMVVQTVLTTYSVYSGTSTSVATYTIMSTAPVRPLTTSYSTVYHGQTVAYTYTGTVMVSNSIAVQTVLTSYSIYSGTSASVATFTIMDTASLVPVATSYSTVYPGQTVARTYTGSVTLSNSAVVQTLVTLYSIYSGTAVSIATQTITDVASLEALATAASTSASAQTSLGEYKYSIKYASTDVVMKTTFKHMDYFAALYLGPILAVVAKALWEIIASSLKMIEPFQRMGDKSGVSAKYSILTQYLSSIVSRDAFRALAHGHLLPFWSLITYLLVVVAAPIAAISMNVVNQGQCTMPDNSALKPCDQAWVIHKPIIRALEAEIVTCMVLLVCFMCSTRKFYIAVATNPSSIATIASLMNHRPLLRDLERIDPFADRIGFSAALDNHLFRLDRHQDQKNSYWRYGIINAKPKPPDIPEPFEGAWLRGMDVSENTAFMKSNDDRSPYLPRPEQHPIIRLFTDQKSSALIIDLLHLFTTSALFAIVATYTFDNNINDAFNQYFISRKTLPKVIVVGLATVVDIQIKNLERVIRINEPFRRLAARNAKPETTILLSLNGTCWSNLPQCIYLLFAHEFRNGRMLWQTIVTIVAALSDFNIIAAAGILYEDAQITSAAATCAYGSVAITLCILLVVLVTILWWRRSEVIREMPRQPETIGAVMSYLCSSELVREWMESQSVRAEELGPEQMAILVRGEGRRYFFGKVPGMDGRERWCIDIDSWRDEKEARSRASAYII